MGSCRWSTRTGTLVCSQSSPRRKAAEKVASPAVPSDDREWWGCAICGDSNRPCSVSRPSPPGDGGPGNATVAHDDGGVGVGGKYYLGPIKSILKVRSSSSDDATTMHWKVEVAVEALHYSDCAGSVIHWNSSRLLPF